MSHFESSLTTYQSGIIQASARRLINRFISDYLMRYDLTAMQWFTLGCIYDAGPDGIRLSSLTRELSTTLPYVTNTITLLESKGMVRKVTHEDDGRIKLVSITPNYRANIEAIENGLQDHLRENLYEGTSISPQELQTYTSTLIKLANP